MRTHGQSFRESSLIYSITSVINEALPEKEWTPITGIITWPGYQHGNALVYKGSMARSLARSLYFVTASLNTHKHIFVSSGSRKFNRWKYSNFKNILERSNCNGCDLRAGGTINTSLVWLRFMCLSPMSCLSCQMARSLAANLVGDILSWATLTGLATSTIYC